MLPRVFLSGDGAPGLAVHIDGEDGHHFARVLRAQPSEQLVLAMDNGPWLGEISEVQSQAIVVHIQSPYRRSEPTIHVTVVQALAKGDKMDAILQKCTEVGAHSFVAFQSERSVVKLQGKVDSKLARWEKIIREASMQSQRDRIPGIRYEKSFDAILQSLTDQGVDCFAMLDEAEEATGLVALLKDVQRTNPALSIALFIGPEGGWSERERASILQHERGHCVTLGRRILRTETAGSTALAIALAHFGDMGG